jgi:hypothetical protein
MQIPCTQKKEQKRVDFKEAKIKVGGRRGEREAYRDFFKLLLVQ